MLISYIYIQHQSQAKRFRGADIGFRIPNAKELYERTGCNLLMLEYRGYGSSEGDDSVLREKGLMIDAQTGVALRIDNTCP